MPSRLLLAALAASAALLSPAVASQAAAQTSACTQLESSAGLRGTDCGRLTTAQLAVLHGDRAGG